MIGSVISEAPLLKYVWTLHEALEQWEAHAVESLFRAPSTHVDETSMRVDKNSIGFMSTLPEIRPYDLC
ncbi:hypothetical protein DSLASN_21110 [Desulfoluna limicola]|uniref:Transposase n=2 Tax=Desulfoluna limicola TaxID=2810562 RepID=A0ABM7PFV5_9BACT|nr:hypothetical protein DSLASN_21110 [Desulfoluna limicola]